MKCTWPKCDCMNVTLVGSKTYEPKECLREFWCTQHAELGCTFPKCESCPLRSHPEQNDEIQSGLPGPGPNRHGWHPVGDGTPLGAWLETTDKPEEERSQNVCIAHVAAIGEEVEWCEMASPGNPGRTTVTHTTFAPPTHWRWPHGVDEAKRPDAILAEASKLFKERNATYGDNWRMVGEVLKGLFPNGVELKTAHDHNRFHILSLMIVKLTRYCVNWKNGGHQDSIRDNTVYSAMQEFIDALGADERGATRVQDIRR